jgi:hypothetical protein
LEASGVLGKFTSFAKLELVIDEDSVRKEAETYGHRILPRLEKDS